MCSIFIFVLLDMHVLIIIIIIIIIKNAKLKNTKQGGCIDVFQSIEEKRNS